MAEKVALLEKSDMRALETLKVHPVAEVKRLAQSCGYDQSAAFDEWAEATARTEEKRRLKMARMDDGQMSFLTSTEHGGLGTGCAAVLVPLLVTDVLKHLTLVAENAAKTLAAEAAEQRRVADVLMRFRDDTQTIEDLR